MSFKHLASKLLAGGLTAGIVLIWWPRHYPTEGLQWLVLRGVIGTLLFELLLLAYAPLEERISRRLARRTRVDRLKARVDAVPATARTGGSYLFAGGALALPILLLATAGAPPPPKAEAKPAAPKVIRQVIVRRQVIRDEVVVRAPVTPAPAPSAATPAPAASAPAARPAAKRTPAARERASAPAAATPAPTRAAPTPAPVSTPAPAPTTPAADANAQTAVTEPLPTG
jgi:hypothetical protein